MIMATAKNNSTKVGVGPEYPLMAPAIPQMVKNRNACHGGDADDAFTQYYPVLRAAKTSGHSE